MSVCQCESDVHPQHRRERPYKARDGVLQPYPYKLPYPKQTPCMSVYGANTGISQKQV